jgi:hypothetical protein
MDVTKRSPRETKKVTSLLHEMMCPKSPQWKGASLHTVMQFKKREQRIGDFKGLIGWMYRAVEDRDQNVRLRGF